MNSTQRHKSLRLVGLVPEEKRDGVSVEIPTIFSTLSIPQNGTTVPILAEIIGATNLRHPSIPDSGTLQPFVIAKLKVGDDITVLRQTKQVKNFCDPVWCVKDRCLFLIHVSKQMLSNSDNDEKSTTTSIILEVRHQDSKTPSSCTLLGSACMKLSEVLGKRAEERLEVSLESSWNNSSEKAIGPEDTEDDSFEFSFGWQNEEDSRSKIALRFRPATDLDLKFMQVFEQMINENDYSYFLRNETNEKERIIEDSFGRKIYTRSGQNLITEVPQNQNPVGITGVFNMISQSFRGKIKDPSGLEKKRVKPYPDPDNKDDTTFLSSEELQTEVFKPSTKWLHASQTAMSSLGMLHLEILSCKDLPNMDTGEAIGNYTDAFVCAAYEDSIVQTDVINDELSPMWMPWSKRAFVFPIRHTLSPLYVAVADYDIGPGRHDGVGRVAINLNHFESNMEYTLKYTLYPSANTWDRDGVGTITIRLRKEIVDDKALLMSSLKPPPRFNINMQKEATLSVANFTCCGEHNADCYDVKLLRCYINELLEMKLFLSYVITDALNSLVMWQGQVKVGPLWLPLHSACAFLGGIYLVERPHLVPGFIFIGIAWMMIAFMLRISNHPSPWQKERPMFSRLIYTLIYGNSVPPVTEIKIGEGHEETIKFETSWQNRLQADQEASTKIWEVQQAVEQFGNQEMHTAEKKLKLDPLENALVILAPKLFPIQKKLRSLCELVRQIRAVVTWEQNLLSFWLTLACLVIGITLLILPTTLLLHIGCRIFVWVCLGPWIRIYYIFNSFEHANPVSLLHSNEGKNKHIRGTLKKVARQFNEKGRVARLNGEESLKMKAMRILKYGTHIAKIPSINYSRHYDYPLSEGSSAIHISRSSASTFTSTYTIIEPSQWLKGCMIPVSEEDEIKQMNKSKDISKAKCTVKHKVNSEGKESVTREGAGDAASSISSDYKSDSERSQKSDSIVNAEQRSVYEETDMKMEKADILGLRGDVKKINDSGDDDLSYEEDSHSHSSASTASGLSSKSSSDSFCNKNIIVKDSDLTFEEESLHQDQVPLVTSTASTSSNPTITTTATTTTNHATIVTSQNIPSSHFEVIDTENSSVAKRDLNIREKIFKDNFFPLSKQYKETDHTAYVEEKDTEKIQGEENTRKADDFNERNKLLSLTNDSEDVSCHIRNENGSNRDCVKAESETVVEKKILALIDELAFST